MSEQKVVISTAGGAKEFPAPGGWKFDKTQAVVWVKMMTTHQTFLKLARTHRVSKRDTMVVDGKVEILGNILSATLGMATPYWVQTAKEFAERYYK
jgi:hypothetical protein